MNILIVYYSRTGNTKALVAVIARRIGAEVERIADKRSREGALGYYKCSLDQTFNLSPPLKPMRTDPSQYDIVLVGGPIWGSTCCTPIRTFLKGVEGTLAKVAFFCTMREGNEVMTFLDMQTHCGTEPFATLAVTEDEIGEVGMSEDVAAFAEQCRTGMVAVRRKRRGEV